MNQITDSLAPPAGDRARTAGKPQRNDTVETPGEAAEALGAVATQSDVPTRKTPPGRGFAAVMQANATGTKAHQDPSAPVSAAPAETGTQTDGADGAKQATNGKGTEAENPAQRPLLAGVQRPRPDLAIHPLPTHAKAIRLSGSVAEEAAALKAASREFADQMTGGSARLAPAAPMQDIAALRPVAAAPAATADTAAGDSLADTGPEPQPSALGTDRQALLITPMRATPAAAAPLLQAQPAPQTATPEAILAQINTHISTQGRSEMTLRLDPPELGLVRIGLTMGEGQVIAVINAERPDIDSMLRRYAAQLTAALEDAGYQGVDLSFGDGGSDCGGEHTDPGTAASDVVRLTVAEPTGPEAPPGTGLHADGLDLRF